MRVLFVCAGNICRSPIAEALFRHHAAFHASLQDVEVGSAGVIALDGDSPVDLAVDVTRRELALDVSRHRATRLKATTAADLVLTLDAWVQERAARLGLRTTVQLLGDFAGSEGEEVPDPYGGPVEGYRVTVHQLERLIKAAVARLSRERSGFDLRAYVARIGLTEAPRADLATLTAVHRGHVCSIPFENLDIQLGRPIRLDLPSLQAKIVHQKRGGYCFEQNTLLLHALRTLGFEVAACEARVRSDSHRVIPRTHMVLVVTLEGQRWLCDGGFGGDCPLEPVAFGGAEHHQSHWTYRLIEEGSLQVLQIRGEEGWTDLYAFVPQARYPVDFEVSNWYTSTWPESRFVLTLTAQRSSPEARHVLRNLSLSVSDGRGTTTHEISREELGPILRDTMLIDVPADARFLALDGS